MIFTYHLNNDPRETALSAGGSWYIDHEFYGWYTPFGLFVNDFVLPNDTASSTLHCGSPYYHLNNFANETELTAGMSWYVDGVNYTTTRQGGLFISDLLTPTEIGGTGPGSIPFYGSCAEYCNLI